MFINSSVVERSLMVLTNLDNYLSKLNHHYHTFKGSLDSASAPLEMTPTNNILIHKSSTPRRDK
jgi:hypothetical protein